MNYLALAQMVVQECRISGTGPSDITGQTREYQRVLTWTARAWRAIQSSNPYWRFMRKSATCPTVQAQALYSPTTDFGLTDFGRWALDYANGDTFRNYDTTAGIVSEVAMQPVDYDVWRDTYQFGAARSTYSRPAVIAVAPLDSLAVGPVAASGYTLVGDYYCKPVLLAAATDTPACPEEFHEIIVFKAMQYYGVSEAAPEIYDLGVQEYNRMYADLTKHQAPRYRLAGALV